MKDPIELIREAWGRFAPSTSHCCAPSKPSVAEIVRDAWRQFAPSPRDK